MKRRRLLETSATLCLCGLAGCGSLDREETTPPTTPGPVPTDAPTPTPRAERARSVAGVELPIPLTAMSRVLPPDGLLAIEEPAFDPDWGELELLYIEGGEELTIRPRLTDVDPVIGIEGAEASRAYPLRVLNWHEVVNDRFEGQPLLVTYCPVCGSGMAAVRRVAGEETVFGVTGLLWRENLVMYDELTRSLWSQVAATAIHGPEWGRRLQLVPASLTTWGEWRAAHPDTRVLLPPPHSRTVFADLIERYEIDTTRDYTQDPYAAFRPSGTNGDLHPLTLVIGVTAGDEVVAYPLTEFSAGELVNDIVGDLPVVVTALNGETLVAYARTVDGETYQFTRVDSQHMRAAGTTWEIQSGTGVAGRYEGTQLERANTFQPLYLRSWQGFYPDTSVFSTGENGTEVRTQK